MAAMLVPGTRSYRALQRCGTVLAFALVQALCWTAAAQAAVCTSQTTGSWNAGATWTGCGGGVPGFGDTAIIASTHTVTVNANVVAGALTVNSGGLLNVNNVNFTVFGATNVSGTLAHPAAGRAKNYGGRVTINAGGVWSNASNQAVSFYGGITHNGASFNSGTGMQTFNTTTNNATTQTLGGVSPMNFDGPVTVEDNVTITNNNTNVVTITGTLTAATGNSVWVNGANSTLNYANATAPMAGGTLNASANPNTVNYTGAAQAIQPPSASYHHLILSGSGLKTVAANLQVNGDLTITGSASFVAGTSRTHTFNGNWIVDTTAATPFSFTTASVINFNTPAVAASTSISGTSTATIVFNDVNVNNTSGVVLNQNVSFSLGSTPTLTVAAGATLTPSAAAVISGTGALTGNGTVRVTRIAAGTENFNSQYTIATKTLTNLTVEYTGTAAQTISIQTYSGLRINNASGVMLLGDTTVGTLLTLTAGNITTNASTLIAGAPCATSVARISGYIVGNLRKAIPAGASTCTFEIGSGAGYTPVVLTFVAGTGAGNITASTTEIDHGSLASSGIDATKNVNRFWTLINGGVNLPLAGFTARFNFINGSPVDFDSGSNTANFIVERWDGTNWFPTTLNATCAATPAANRCEQVNGLAAFGDFAAGEGKPGFNGMPGDFNVFESGTPNGAILGRIHTKLANTAMVLDIVRVNAPRTGVNAVYNSTAVWVQLLDARDNTGALDATTNCRSTWTALSLQQSVSPTWSGGRATITINALGDAGRDVRVRVSPTGGAGVAGQGCSTDRFAIRPTEFTSITSNMNNATSSGLPALKTGQNFTFTAATGLNGYDNGSAATLANPQVIPSIDSGKVTGSPTAGTIGGSFSAASSGTVTGGAFFYSEVGNLAIGINGIFDSTFTAVDQPSDCTADFSNTLVGGKYGCNFGNSSISGTIGRFTPDNFAVSLNVPQFTTACGAFTYVGQRFTYATAPVITVTARNGTNNGLTNQVTQNYTGAWWKLIDSKLTGYAYAVAAGALNTGATLPAPIIADGGGGSGAITFNSGTAPNAGFLFTRTAPVAPFDAQIQLSINVIDEDSVAAVTNPVQFGTLPSNGISFSGAKAMRFGRLKLGSAYGSELLNLSIPIETQYWTGTSFVTNAADSCTTIGANNVSLTNHIGGINTVNMPQTSVVTGGAFANGVGLLRLNKPAPTPANKGSVDVCVDLGPDSGLVCNAAASATMPWLQGRWGVPAAFSDDPASRATFGVYRAGPIIYRRELY